MISKTAGQKGTDTSNLEANLAEPNVIADFRNLSGRIGILGGSFDPVHHDHLEIARLAREKFKLDKLVFLPARRNPLKDRVLASDADRLAMLKLALKGKEGFYLCPLELEQSEVCYTIDMIRLINSQVSVGAKLFFIVGSDVLENFHRWKEPKELLKLTDFILVNRLQYPPEKADLSVYSEDERQKLLQHRVPDSQTDVSSTAIRTAAAKKEDVSRFTGMEVAEYIKKHNLYS